MTNINVGCVCFLVWIYYCRKIYDLAAIILFLDLKVSRSAYYSVEFLDITRRKGREGDYIRFYASFVKDYLHVIISS